MWSVYSTVKKELSSNHPLLIHIADFDGFSLASEKMKYFQSEGGDV